MLSIFYIHGDHRNSFNKTRTNQTSSHALGETEQKPSAFTASPADAHFGMVSLLQLLFVQLDLGIMLLSHLMQGLSQLVLVLNLTPRIHLYQASFMLSSGFVNLLGRKNDRKPSYLTKLPWLISRPSEVLHTNLLMSVLGQACE